VSSRTDDSTDEETVRIFESDGKIVARDESTGVSSFGETKSEALERLSEAIDLYEQPVHEDEDVENEATAPWL
jgi:predicted RNase H-like HicB family nuclease